MISVSAITHIFILLFLVLSGGAVPLKAEIALLVAEPFGKFGYFNPTGHAAIYISGICAETPTLLRPCEPGEPGVVISRYNRVAGFDWIAVPLLPYLYAVETPEEVPINADKEQVAQLRDSYRKARLLQLVPDDPKRKEPKGDWKQLIGSSYDRNIYGFAIKTTPEDDARLIQYLNSRENRRRFHLIWRNCADFTRNILNFYYPGAVKRNIIGDLGIMTPKQAAKSLVKFSQRHPELNLTHFMISQIPGNNSSSKLRGVNESLIRSSKYAVPLIVLQPWVAVSATVAYFTFGRFNPGRYEPVLCEPSNVSTCAAGRKSGIPPEEQMTDAEPEIDGNTDLISESLPNTSPGEQSENAEHP